MTPVSERLGLLVAHRPNVSYPTYAAKAFASLDHISDGRLAVHFITGGTTSDQAAEGDFLDKDDRYLRTHEYIQIVKKAWREAGPFGFAGRYFSFDNFEPDITPLREAGPPISFGGSSPAAYKVGAAEAYVYALRGDALWGEPPATQARPVSDRPGERGLTTAVGPFPGTGASREGPLHPHGRTDGRRELGGTRRFAGDRGSGLDGTHRAGRGH